MRPRKMVLAVVAIFSTLAVLVLLPRQKQPFCDNRSLSAWLAAYDDAVSYGDAEQTDQAAAAVQSIGTNAVPWLLVWLNNDTPEWKMVILRRCNPIIAKVNRKWTMTDDALGKQSRARYGFKILGASAASAVPELGRMLISSNDLASFHSAMSLGYVGEAGWPTLYAALTNQDETIWFNVCRVLEDLGTNSAPVIPILVQNLSDADPAVRFRAANALVKLPIEPAIAVPALVKVLHDLDNSVREASVRALAEHESQAILAVPALLQLRNDPNPFIRDLTDRALIRIDRKALARSNSR